MLPKSTSHCGHFLPCGFFGCDANLTFLPTGHGVKTSGPHHLFHDTNWNHLQPYQNYPPPFFQPFSWWQNICNSCTLQLHHWHHLQCTDILVQLILCLCSIQMIIHQVKWNILSPQCTGHHFLCPQYVPQPVKQMCWFQFIIYLWCFVNSPTYMFLYSLTHVQIFVMEKHCNTNCSLVNTVLLLITLIIFTNRNATAFIFDHVECSPTNIVMHFTYEVASQSNKTFTSWRSFLLSFVCRIHMSITAHLCLSTFSISMNFFWFQQVQIMFNKSKKGKSCHFVYPHDENLPCCWLSYLSLMMTSTYMFI